MRYLPMRTVLDQIRPKVIEVQTLTANLAYPVGRRTDVNLAAGVVARLSVYTINFAMMVFGNRIETIDGCAPGRTGVDRTP